MRRIFQIEWVILGLAFFLNEVKVSAQNAAFSQVDFAPFTINPALAGLHDDLNVNAIVRGNQVSNQKLLTRMNFSFDAAVNGRRKYKKGRFGLGLNYNNERGSSAALKNNLFQLNVAYNWFFRKWSTLGFGAYFGYAQNRHTPISFDTINNPFIVGGEERNGHIDFGAGFLYTYKKGNSHMVSNNQTSLDVGAAVYHINNPAYYFLADLSVPYRMRYSAFAKASFGIGNNMSLMPALYYQFITLSRHDVLLGTHLKFNLKYGSKYSGYNKSSSIAFGFFYRYLDHVIFNALYQWGYIHFGASFDLGATSFAPDLPFRAGAELVFRYTVPSFYMKPIGGRTGRSY